MSLDNYKAFTGNGVWRKEKETTQQVPSKLKLIDILNKIANGELKEGTKVKVGEQTFTLEIDDDVYGTDLVDLDDECNESIMQYTGLSRLNDEVELIEPNDFGEADKMIEPTDNTKIEELNVKGLCEIFEGKHTVTPILAFSTALNKLNEVIRYINK